ncbi:ureide permease-like [Raphidocelis subcapitata]|uniref:Ureide permease-like n=1 Tax=Raphidocelis subcapitata TaxID=307507 RepID=A0A2V0NY30_9CHLO|nr:ureide permease-like [Raphidocelis subcapitata]|eukprot:GBF92541.1 ureide permease-like [Raphidocelis subcapitata]
MLMLHSLGGAIGLMLIGVLLLGTWPAIWNKVEQRGRIPAHTFLDYATSYLVVAVVTALTFGQLGPDGDPPLNFLDQLRQPNGRAVAFAVAGGATLSVGDVAMQYTTALLGLSIGPPLLNATTVVLGVVLTYFLDGGINRPELVFPGMACATLAIALGAAAHALSHRQQQQDAATAAGAVAAGAAKHGPEDSAHAVCGHEEKGGGGGGGPAAAVVCSSGRDVEQAAGPPAEPEAGRAAKKQRRRAIQSNAKWHQGALVALLGGAIYSLFLPAFQIASTDAFRLLPPGTPPPSVWTTNFYFSSGFWVSSLAVNLVLLYIAPLGGRRSSVLGWLRDGDGRALSVLSGVLAAAGDLTQFIGGQAIGFAAAQLVMAYPLVGVIWGQLHFKEHRGPGRAATAARALIAGQVVLYCASIGLLAGSAKLRE